LGAPARSRTAAGAGLAGGLREWRPIGASAWASPAPRLVDEKGRPVNQQDGPKGLISFDVSFVTKTLILLVLRLIPSGASGDNPPLSNEHDSAKPFPPSYDVGILLLAHAAPPSSLGFADRRFD
jgi:hypothetical protein